MAAKSTQQTQGYIYYDTSGNGYPIAPFQPVCLATAAECATAAAAGVRDAVAGRVVVPAPVGALLGVNMNTRRVVGVTLNATKNGDEVTVVTDGIADTQVNAAVTADAVVYVASQATRTSAQTPFTNNFEMLLPADPSAPAATYNLCLVDDLAPVFASGATLNVPFYPVGIAMAAATAQYDIIPVQLFNPGVAWG